MSPVISLYCPDLFPQLSPDKSNMSRGECFIIWFTLRFKYKYRKCCLTPLRLFDWHWLPSHSTAFLGEIKIFLSPTGPDGSFCWVPLFNSCLLMYHMDLWICLRVSVHRIIRQQLTLSTFFIIQTMICLWKSAFMSVGFFRSSGVIHLLVWFSSDNWHRA